MNLIPGTELTVTIEDIAFGGRGVARIDGMACFVDDVINGEEVKIRLTNIKKNFAEAELLEVISPSNLRVNPECELYGKCGGCQYQHISYEGQLTVKVSQLRQILKRVGGIEEIPEISPVIASPKTYAYRNKITLNPQLNDHNKLAYGYRSRDNLKFLEISKCPLASENINKLISLVRFTPWGKKNSQRDSPKTATLRDSGGDEPIIYYGTAPKGMPWRKEIINGKEFRVPLGSFYQVNPVVAEKLFNLVTEWTSSLNVSRVVDAFCGAGFLSAGIKDKQIIGIEIDDEAIEAAHYNALQWGLKSTKYLAGNANKLINNELKSKGDKTLLIVDPPRQGCGESCLKSIADHKPAFILYVSCDPATLARDLKIIKANKVYEIAKIALLDMFPQTTHFETMILLRKIN